MEEAPARSIAEFKTFVQAHYGERLVRLILFGSQARGTARSDSDVDLLVVLRGDVDIGGEIDQLVDPIYDIMLRHGQVLNVVPMSEERFLHDRTPLLLNVRREGVEA